MSKAEKRYGYKSAVNGRWVTKKFADTHPDTTVKERIDPPKKPRGK
ncbi:MAG TPA: hypothetical protein VG819_11085 [Rhizomicrobium sp.]|jgi:hypothetical protein|nr:hypothetical protein [Rhizomicrobium sp.]